MNRRKLSDGGEGWIRTSVRLRGQIYSLLPLTTRPPLQGVHAQTIRGMVEHGQQARRVAGRRHPVNRSNPMENTPLGSQSRPSLSLRRSIPNPSLGRLWNGAGNGNRTRVFSLEGCCTTIVLYPRLVRRAFAIADRKASMVSWPMRRGQRPKR